jgi:hypothetical protein
MGMVKLLNRIRDATLQEAFDGLFPRDDPVNTRFSINYFTAIGNSFFLKQRVTSIKLQFEYQFYQLVTGCK